MAADESQKSPRVLAIPFPAEDHLSPFLSFAYLLSSHGLSITLLTTETNSPHLQHFLTETESEGVKISTLHLPLPPSPEIPPFKSLPLLAHSLRSLEDPLSHWIQRQQVTSCPVTCIVSDFQLDWTQNVAAKAKIPRIVFNASSAFAVCVENSLWTHLPHLGVKSDVEPFQVPDLPVELSLTRQQIPSAVRQFQKFDPVWESIRESRLLNMQRCRGAVVNTFYDLELLYLNSLHETTGMLVWAVGPILPKIAPDDETRGAREWLDGRDPRSVLYVCVADGSVELLTALAMALESIDIPILWVVNSREIPDGFVGERGHVIRATTSVQQLLILSHPAIGCFMMRGGWTATLVSISMGVPLIVWPAEGDEFCNSVVVVELQKMGARLHGGEGGVVKGEEIKSAVERVMGGGEEARRAEELGHLARKAVKEDGFSAQSINAFIEELRKMASAEVTPEVYPNSSSTEE